MFAAETGVDRLEGLVEHEQARGVHEGAGQGDLLGHARRVIDHGCSGGLAEVHDAQQIGGARGDLVAGQAEHHAGVGHQLLTGEPVEQPHAVGEVADEPLASTGCAQTSTPWMRAVPASGRSSPVAIDSVVVLPAPLGPTRP